MPQIPGPVLRVVRGPAGIGLLLALGLLAACGGGAAAPPPMHISAEAAAADLAVTVNNIPPGREIVAVALRDPGGSETVAREREMITREEGGDSFSGPGVTVGASGGSSSGVNSFISLGYLFRGRQPQRRSRRLIATIPLIDPQGYAAGYRDWRVEVRYRDELGEIKRAQIPAPSP